MLKMISIIFLFTLLCSCNNSNSSNTTTSQVVEPKKIQSNQNTKNNVIKESSYENIESSHECDGDCAPPDYLSLPSHKEHKILTISINAKSHLSAFFLSNINVNEIQFKEIIEPNESNYNLAQGTIIFKDGYLAYTLPSPNESYKNSLIRYTSNNSKQQFTDFENEMLSKIISISGEKNPQRFLQELIASKKNHYYKGCYIQQRESKLGVLELAVCDSDDKKFFTLYNPK